MVAPLSTWPAEAAQTLERNDQKELQKEQKNTRAAMAHHKDMRDLFRLKAKEEKEKEAAASKKGKKPKLGGPAAASGPSKRLPCAEDFATIDTRDAAPWKPPDCILHQEKWPRGNWVAKVHGCQHHVRAWQRHGYGNALRIVLSLAWRDWGDCNGIDEADLPMKDLAPIEECLLV